MKNKIIGIFVCMLFIGTVIPISGTLSLNRVIKQNHIEESNILYVGGSGPNNYTSIQDAIDDASDGFTIFVYDDSSPYNVENLAINKPITLIGENKYTTQINGSGVDGTSVIVVTSGMATISGLNIENSGVGTVTPDSGIIIYNSENCNINNNIITNNNYGICLWNSSVTYTKISDNMIVKNNNMGIVDGSQFSNFSNNNISHNKKYNIMFAYSSNIVIYNNKITSATTHSGIWAQFCYNLTFIYNNVSNNCGCGIQLYDSDNNNISYNKVVGNGWGTLPGTVGNKGIYLRVECQQNVVRGNFVKENKNDGITFSRDDTSYNLIIENDVFDSHRYGIQIAPYYPGSEMNNTIYHNNIINNTLENGHDSGINTWNNGCPSGGNYWDDYDGIDNNGDGIGDIPYYIPEYFSEDNYPLMEPWNLEPYIPNSPEPNHNDNDVSINTILTWKGGDKYPEPVKYDIYFGTSSPPLKVKSNHSLTKYDPGQLDVSTNYYWKIVSRDIHGASSEGPIWKFTTNSLDNSPPYEPNEPNPEEEEMNVSNDGYLEWNGNDPDDDIVTYDVYFGKGIYYHKVASNCSGTNYSVGAIEYNTKYYWKIVAWDEHGDSTSGAKWSFTTIENNPPYPPSDPEPEDGSQDIDINDIILSWNCSDPEGHPITYDVYLEANDPTPDKLVSEKQTETNYEPGTLKYDATYYWQIVAHDSYGKSTDGPIWHFTTTNEPNDPPYQPSDPEPEDGATDINIDTSLSWNCDDPDEGDTVVYDVYFEADDPNPDVKVADDLSKTWFDPGMLDYNTIYYWKIVARDNHYAVNESPIWQFTTEINLPPESPSIDGSIKGASGKKHYYKFTAIDPEEHDVSYYIDWGDGTFDDWSYLHDSGVEVTIGHMWEQKGTYVIKAKARDSYGGESDWAYLEVTMPHSFDNPFLWLDSLLDRFPLLQRLIEFIWHPVKEPLAWINVQSLKKRI